MFKVNEEKILADYLELSEKENSGLAAVEADAKAFAAAHNYSEEQTAQLIASMQGIQGSGLSEKDLAKLEILGAYIEEVAEVPDEIDVPECANDIPAEEGSATLPNVAVNTL